MFIPFISTITALTAGLASSVMLNDPPLDWTDASQMPADSSNLPDWSDEDPPPPEYLVIYDMRDLATMLDDVCNVTDVTGNLINRLMATGVYRHLDYEMLLDGVFYMNGTAEDINLLNAQIEKVHNLYSERFELTLACYNVPEDQAAPTLGEPVQPVESFIEIHQSVMRRAPATITSTTSQSYVYDWQPIVGDQSAGYDPTVTPAEDGLELLVYIGADIDESNARVLLRMDGKLTDAEIRDVIGPTMMGTTKPLEFGVPYIQTRSIHVNLPLVPDQMTAVGVVNGFSGDPPIVIAAKLHRLP
ncbi:MAG: hypothetical protein D8M59_05900 [Planctomycetes bacterium]|nr:hypothetical protein [Planctomycetota bacterium]NOG55884.1 hypothetical protein [Planctomycetota bacterium]